MSTEIMSLISPTSVSLMALAQASLWNSPFELPLPLPPATNDYSADPILSLWFIRNWKQQLFAWALDLLVMQSFSQCEA